MTVGDLTRSLEWQRSTKLDSKNFSFIKVKKRRLEKTKCFFTLMDVLYFIS